MKPVDFFVVIPAYNEAPRIRDVILKVKKYTQKIIVVDDGSTDQTTEVAKKSGALVLRHKLNLGKGAAMKTGAEAAFDLGGQAVIFLDADGQHNPHHLEEFSKKLHQDYDIVFGSRNLSYGVPFVRYLGNKIGSVIICRLFGIYRSDILCGFIGLKEEAYRKIKWESSRYGVETEIVARTGKNKLKYAEVGIETIYLDKYKGVTLFDAIGIMFNLPKWLIS